MSFSKAEKDYMDMMSGYNENSSMKESENFDDNIDIINPIKYKDLSIKEIQDEIDSLKKEIKVLKQEKDKKVLEEINREDGDPSKIRIKKEKTIGMLNFIINDLEYLKWKKENSNSK